MEIGDPETEESPHSLITRSLDHPRNLSTDSQTRFVPGLPNPLRGIVNDKLSQQYDVPTLKSLALNHIRGELRRCNIVEETFSRFTSR